MNSLSRLISILMNFIKLFAIRQYQRIKESLSNEVARYDKLWCYFGNGMG
jgi:hypothetical protein